MAKTNDNSVLRTTKAETTTMNDGRNIEKAFISLISAAKNHEGDSSKDRNESPFLLTASQVNTDLTLAGQCEFEDDLSADDPDQGFFDLLRSDAYWKLRETFIEDAMRGDEYSFLTAIWRAYNAGRLSPDRFIPNTREERNERMNLEVARTLAADAHGASKRVEEVTDAK